MSQPRWRRNTPPTPGQIQTFPVPVSPMAEASPAWERATEEHTLGPDRIAVGVVRHHVTRLFHTVISLYGNDLTTVGVFTALPRALVLANAFGELFQGWRGRSEAESLAMQATLNSEAEAASATSPRHWLLPDRQVAAFLAELASHVQREN